MHNLYEEIIGSGFKLKQPDSDRVWVNYDSKTLCIGKKASENTIYMELALARMLNTSLAKYRINYPNKLKTALAEASTLAWLREFHNKNIRVPFKSPALRDTVVYCLKNGLNEEEMRTAGVPESLTNILSKVQDSIAPTATSIAPTGRMNDAEVVIEYLLKQYEAADKPENPPKDPFSNIEKQNATTKGSGSEGNLGTPKSDESPEEDSEEEDLLEETSSEEDRKADAEKRSKFFKEETERLQREAAEEEVSKKAEEEDSASLKEDVASIVKPPDTPSSSEDGTSKVITLPNYSEASIEDFENTPISPEDNLFKSGSPRYLNLEIITLPLNSVVVQKGLAKKRSVEQGYIPGRFTDPASQRYFQDRGKHFSFTGGASILIDGSGSMQLSEQNIRTLTTTYPTGVVGVYGGPSNSKGTDFGSLAIVARGGRMAANFNRSNYFGGWNSVDGPAIDWLCKQRSPRIFVCDLLFTGIMDREVSAEVFIKTVEKILSNKIICISERSAIKQFTATGKVSAINWESNNNYVRNNFFNGFYGLSGVPPQIQTEVNRDPIFERGFLLKPIVDHASLG